MNVLIIGGGAREHALAWKLRQSPRLDTLYLAPGNAGTARIATNLPITPAEFTRLSDAARNHSIGLTIVGPEAPLAAGVVDHFRAEGLAIVGPTQAAARIESSKVFAKGFMQRHGIPTAGFKVFSDPAQAKAYVEAHSLPVVIKADGLAAGKGVVVAQTREEALAAVTDMMERKSFGESGDRITVEECLTGREVSVFALTDGAHIAPLVAACDYKRIFDGDKGPNTGGMGSYSPPEFWNAELADFAMNKIIRPVIDGLAKEGSPFQGTLYAGLMMTPAGPQVIEFNCRWGDPETQCLMPRLETDLLDVYEAIANGTLDKVALAWRSEACVSVAMASAGYPGAYTTGKSIRGLDTEGSAIVFHAATKSREGQVVTDGGRVLSVSALGGTLDEARQAAYRGVEQIEFEGAYYRADIAAVKETRK